MVDANLHRTTFGYDANGRVVKMTDALSRIATFGYDVANQLSNRTDPRGVRTTFVYSARLMKQLAAVIPTARASHFRTTAAETAPRCRIPAAVLRTHMTCCPE